MAKFQIGAQMYTLRDFCRTPADIAAACAKVKKMGYQGIQASAAGFSTIDGAELKRILDGEGLACAATHEDLLAMDAAAVQRCIDKHKLLGCRYTAIGGYFPRDPWTLKLWQDFAAKFNRIAQAFAGSGVQLGYHNHSHELSPVAPGKTALQFLVDTLSPDLWFEIDTYWIAHGGGDPAAWIDKVAGRIPCVHLKDFTITPDRTPKMCEIGAGNLNWPRIFKACQSAGCQWLLIERDAGDLDPFDSLRVSFDNLRSMGIA
jgi:sugar phosphate isomerase/epimerase